MNSTMDSSSIGLIVALIFLLMASAYFSATETAFSSLSRIRLLNRMEDDSDKAGAKRAAATLKLADDFDRVLSTILVGNNIVNITAATLGTLLFTRLYKLYGPTISTIVLTLVILSFGEIGPKTAAKAKAESFAIWSTPSLRVIMVILTPLTALFGLLQDGIVKLFHINTPPSITEEEILTMVSAAENQGGLDPEESLLIQSAIEFGDMDADEVLTPRVDIVAISDEADPKELEELFASNQFSRIPVWHGSIDNITKVIHVRDFYRAKRDGIPWQDLATDVLTTAPSTGIDDLLRQMQAQKTHMAVVVDEFGGTQGLVTLEDILEELVGEIWDEHDEVEEDRIREQADGTYLISWRADIDDVFELLHLHQPTDADDFTSVPSWVVECLGHPPKVGDQFTYENALVSVTQVSRRRVLQIRAELLPEEEED